MLDSSLFWCETVKMKRSLLQSIPMDHCNRLSYCRDRFRRTFKLRRRNHYLENAAKRKEFVFGHDSITLATSNTTMIDSLLHDDGRRKGRVPLPHGTHHGQAGGGIAVQVFAAPRLHTHTKTTIALTQLSLRKRKINLLYSLYLF